MILLGHRGARASRHIPENTVESFELCLLHGCDGFEFDVRLASDGAAVVCHDPVMAGHEIASTPSARLALPTLDEVLQRFSGRAFLDIELKVAGIERPLIAALRAYRPQKGYVISSFLPEVLSAVNKLDAGIPLGFLWDRQEQVAPPALSLAYLIPQFPLITRALTEQAHAANQKIMTWTVNRAEDMQRFADWGVDAIISDNTELLVQTFR